MLVIQTILLFIISITTVICASGIYVFFFMPHRISYYDGPIPTQDELKQIDLNITAHIEEFPHSGLREAFPDIAQNVRVGYIYRHLEFLRINNLIGENEYQRQLDEILPMIDISNDILP